jgi:hypothetical protein
MKPLFPDMLTTGAGIVTLAIGTGLVFAPEQTSDALGLGLPKQQAQALGVADLVLAPFLLKGGRRAGPMLVRTGMNAAVVAIYRRSSHQQAARSAVTMSVLTVVDGLAALSLRRAGR